MNYDEDESRVINKNLQEYLNIIIKYSILILILRKQYCKNKNIKYKHEKIYEE